MGKNRLLNTVWHVMLLGFSCQISAFNGFGSEVDGYIKEASARYQVSESMVWQSITHRCKWRRAVYPGYLELVGNDG